MPLHVTPVDRVHSWESQFPAMERQWRRISRRRTEALLTEWSAAQSAMRREHDRLLAEGLWLTGPSDFLAIIGLDRHENTHSRILKWLLSPTGRHGLGSALVTRLLDHCTLKPVPAPLPVRTVNFSQWRNGREADLVVWGEDFTLVIENKVDAIEQPHQCDDLYANFKNENAPSFLFLTPDGRKPLTATTPEAQRAFRTLSWPKVRALIEAETIMSRSASGTAVAANVVENYLRTLKEQFG